MTDRLIAPYVPADRGRAPREDQKPKTDRISGQYLVIALWIGCYALTGCLSAQKVAPAEDSSKLVPSYEVKNKDSLIVPK